jgi:hypothetical protein
MTTTRVMLATLMLALGLAATPAAPRAEESGDPAALAAALRTVKLPLQDGFRSSEAQGLPISGKYELEDGALQLSVYTTAGGKFYEVIVDHATGKVAKRDELHKADDIAAANEQVVAMALVKTSLATVADKAVATNGGARAISVTPMLKDGRTLASVTLLRGLTITTVEQPID